MLGNDYMCHLNYAHDIFETDDGDGIEGCNPSVIEREKNGIFQCEVCDKTLKGKKTIEGHIRSQHSHIVKELAEEVGDFYSLLQAVDKHGGK